MNMNIKKLFEPFNLLRLFIAIILLVLSIYDWFNVNTSLNSWKYMQLINDTLVSLMILFTGIDELRKPDNKINAYLFLILAIIVMGFGLSAYFIGMR
jgi:CDP-diglyceride synthetase